MQPMLGLYRAVVINTYAPDEPTNRTKTGIECDVILVRSNVPMTRVPVAARIGTNDAQTWSPKPTTRTISGLPVNLRFLSSRGTVVGIVPPLDDLNGDIVIVEFVEGDIDYPLITRPFPHPQSKREMGGFGHVEGTTTTARGKPSKTDYYVRHGGTELRINEAGDVLIDTVGATTDEVGEVPAATGGAIRLRAKDTQAVTVELDGAEVLKVYRDPGTGFYKIDMSDAPSQAFVRGNDLEQALRDVTNALDTWAAAVNGAFAGITGPPGPLVASNATLLAATTAMRAAVLAALSQVIRGK